MKKALLALMLTAAALGLLCPAVAEETPRVVLYTYYRQMGWGDRVEIGWVDEAGDVWLLTGHDEEMRWPYAPDAQLERLAACPDANRLGALPVEERNELLSLAAAVQPQEGKPVPAACDAGTEYSYAVQYGESGEAQSVLLGMSGDDRFENADPAAQRLYACLRLLFPQVTCYTGVMGPSGTP